MFFDAAKSDQTKLYIAVNLMFIVNFKRYDLELLNQSQKDTTNTISVTSF